MQKRNRFGYGSFAVRGWTGDPYRGAEDRLDTRIHGGRAAMGRGTQGMLGHKIRRFRNDQGLSQVEMAGQIGISPTTSI